MLFRLNALRAVVADVANAYSGGKVYAATNIEQAELLPK